MIRVTTPFLWSSTICRASFVAAILTVTFATDLLAAVSIRSIVYDLRTHAMGQVFDYEVFRLNVNDDDFASGLGSLDFTRTIGSSAGGGGYGRGNASISLNHTDSVVDTFDLFSDTGAFADDSSAGNWSSSGEGHALLQLIFYVTGSTTIEGSLDDYFGNAGVLIKQKNSAGSFIQINSYSSWDIPTFNKTLATGWYQMEVWADAYATQGGGGSDSSGGTANVHFTDAKIVPESSVVSMLAIISIPAAFMLWRRYVERRSGCAKLGLNN